MADPNSRAANEAAQRIRDEPTARLTLLSDAMFEKVSQYVRAELETTCDDYQLLETLNNMTADRYREMSSQMGSVNQELARLFEKHAALAEYVHQISELEDGIMQLEKTVADLDSYSRRLEAKFEQLQSRV